MRAARAPRAGCWGASRAAVAHASCRPCSPTRTARRAAATTTCASDAGRRPGGARRYVEHELWNYTWPRAGPLTVPLTLCTRVRCFLYVGNWHTVVITYGPNQSMFVPPLAELRTVRVLFLPLNISKSRSFSPGVSLLHPSCYSTGQVWYSWLHSSASMVKVWW